MPVFLIDAWDKLNRTANGAEAEIRKEVFFDKGKIYRTDSVKLSQTEWKIIRREIDNGVT